jgi:hypothetical protein
MKRKHMKREATTISDALLKARDAFMAWHECSNSEFPDPQVKEDLAVEAILALSDVIGKSSSKRLGDLLTKLEMDVVHKSMMLIRRDESDDVFHRSITEVASKFMEKFGRPRTED